MDEHKFTGVNPKQQRGPLASDLGQLALWSAANLAGMATALLAIREPFFRRMMQKVVGKRRSRARRPSPRQSLPILADAIIGSTRKTILSVFGPPRSAALDRFPSADVPLTFWHATTWYYPLARQGLMAMAINFEENHARCVEFFQMPAEGAPLSL